MLPVLLPLQSTLVTDAILTVSPGVLPTITAAVAIHAFASVTVTVYVPAVNPVAVALVPPLGAHENVYAGVPPEGEAVAVPLGSVPPQAEGVDEPAIAIARGCVIIAEAVAVHPLASVTVTVYVPALRLLAVALVPPLGVHAKVYGTVPPKGFAVAEPVLPPLHLSLIIPPVVTLSAAAG